MELSQESKSTSGDIVIYENDYLSLGENLKRERVTVLSCILVSVALIYFNSQLDLAEAWKPVFYSAFFTGLLFVFFRQLFEHKLMIKFESDVFSMATRFRKWSCPVATLQFREHIPKSGSRMIQVERKSGKKDVIWESAFTDYDRFRTDLIAMNLLKDKGGRA